MIYKKPNKMNLSNPAIVVVVVLIFVVLYCGYFLSYGIGTTGATTRRTCSVLKLAKANVSTDIPISKGYIDGNIAYFIATDALLHNYDFRQFWLKK
ncbi:MAG: hypothetical protein ACM3VV_01280 [Deltaproteobacteria bacterium]